MSLFWIRRDYPTPSHPISLKSTLILSSLLCLGLLSGVFSPLFPTETHQHVSSLHACHRPQPISSLSSLSPNNNFTGRTNNDVPHYANIFFSFLFLPLWPKNLPRHLFLEHAQPTSCFNVRDQVSHPYVSKTTGETTYRLSLYGALQACWRISLIISSPKASINCQLFLQRTTNRPADSPHLTLSWKFLL